MPPQIADRTIGARGCDAICLTEKTGSMSLRIRGFIAGTGQDQDNVLYLSKKRYLNRAILSFSRAISALKTWRRERRLMPSANGNAGQGHFSQIPHRCHKKEFPLKFVRERRQGAALRHVTRNIGRRSASFMCSRVAPHSVPAFGSMTRPNSEKCGNVESRPPNCGWIRSMKNFC